MFVFVRVVVPLLDVRQRVCSMWKEGNKKKHVKVMVMWLVHHFRLHAFRVYATCPAHCGREQEHHR